MAVNHKTKLLTLHFSIINMNSLPRFSKLLFYNNKGTALGAWCALVQTWQSLFPLHQGQYQASTQTTWQVLLHGTSLDGTRVTYLTTVYFTFLHHLASHDHYYPKYHNISLMLYFLSVVFFFYCQYPLQFLAILSSLALECIGKYISLTKAWESTD